MTFLNVLRPVLTTELLREVNLRPLKVFHADRRSGMRGDERCAG
jgi:hypothetical protein